MSRIYVIQNLVVERGVSHHKIGSSHFKTIHFRCHISQMEMLINAEKLMGL